MTGTNRREALLDCLLKAPSPVTGKELSDRFGVSRQVIVQDIALLRASGKEIVGTMRGYLVLNRD